MQNFWHRQIRKQNRHTLIAWLPALAWVVIAAILSKLSVGKMGTRAGQAFFYYSKWFLLAALLLAIISAFRRKLTILGWMGLVPSTLLTLFQAALFID